MLWYSVRTAKAVTVMQEIKQMAVDIAVNQLRLAQYQIREIRPEDLPSPSVVDFTVTIAANAASRVVVRRLQSNSLIIIAGFYCPDVKNNITGILPTELTAGHEGEETYPQPFEVTLGHGNPILKHVWFTRGTELIRRWPLCPVYADADGAKVTEGYVIYYPDDVAIIQFFAKDQATIDQVSQTWYLGVSLLPPGGTTATELVN